MSQSTEALAWRNVGKVFANQHEALRDVTLDVAPGECLALLGTSGSGKSTMLRMVNRLVEPSTGDVVVGGRSVKDWNPIELRRSIGYVIQDAGLMPHLDVLANIALVPRLMGIGKREREQKALELMELVGLDPARHASRLPRELSGGERQRVGLARALAADPPTILMDEPFGALDPITRRSVQDEFNALRKRLQKTIVLVTHDVREACRLADRLAVLRQGTMLAVGTPAELMVHPDPFIQEFFQDAKAVAISGAGATS